MTDFSSGSRRIEVVISGVVSVESLRPIHQCIRQLMRSFDGRDLCPAGSAAEGQRGSIDTYVIRAADVTSVEIAAAKLLQAMVVELTARGAAVRWAAASRSLVRTARALELDRPLGLTSAVPV